MSAGLAKTFSPIGFLALKVVLGAVGVALGVVVGALTGSPLRALILGGSRWCSWLLRPGRRRLEADEEAP